MKKILTFLIFSIIIFKTSYAADTCSMVHSGYYDNILNTFVGVTATWQAKLLPLVTRIFWGVFAAEFLYQLTFKKILSNDLSKLYIFFVIRMFTAYIFAFVFLNLQTYMGIIGFFTRIGGDLGGSATHLNLSGGTAGMGITPSGMLGFLECKFGTIMVTVGTMATFAGIFSSGVGTFLANSLVIMIILINLIAVILLITMIDAYVVIFGGFILVGFSGSSWTQSYWQKYLSYAVGTGIRLFMTCLILGLVSQAFSNIPTTNDPFNYIFSLLGVLIMSVYLVMTVPSKAASMLTGSMGGGMGELVGAASMLMAGGSMAKLAGGGAKNQASALMEKLGGPGKNPSPSTLKSNTTTATQSAKSETAKSGKVEAMGKSMGQGEQPTPKPKFNDSLPDSGSTPAPTSSGGSPSSSSSGSTPAPTSSTGNPSSSSSGSTPAPSGSGGNSGSISDGKGSTTPQPSTKATLAKHGKSFADSVNKVSSGHAGAADININPHKE